MVSACVCDCVCVSWKYYGVWPFRFTSLDAPVLTDDSHAEFTNEAHFVFSVLSRCQTQIRYLSWKIHRYDDLISFVRHLIRWLIANAGCLGKMLTQTLAFITYPQKYDVSIDFLEGLDCYRKQRAALQNISSWIFMKLSVSNCNSFSGCQHWQCWVYLTQITPITRESLFSMSILSLLCLLPVVS